MKNLYLALSLAGMAAAFSAGTAFAGDPARGPSTASPGDELPSQTGGVTAQTNGPFNTVDQQFIPTAGTAGLFEVDESDIIAAKTHNAVLRGMAQKLAGDHMMLNQKLKDIAIANGVGVPDHPDGIGQEHIDRLNSLSGTAADAQFLADQTAAHQQAIALFQRESQDGMNPALKQFATDGLPTLRDHLAMVQQMNAAATTGSTQ
jgi:putative membrane protein